MTPRCVPHLRSAAVALALLGGMPSPARPAGPVASRTADSSASLSGLERPEAELEQTLRMSSSSRPPTPVVRHCSVYAHHAVLWTTDTDIGAKDLVVRPRRHAEPPKDLCAPRFPGRTRTLEREGSGVPIGAIGRFLVLVWPDTFGVAESFSIYDLDSGKKAYEGSWNTGRPVAFRLDGRELTIDYWSLLEKQVCAPVSGAPDCWERLKQANGIPPPAPTAAPDCEPIVRKTPEAAKDPRALQISVHCLLSRLSPPTFDYPADAGTCDLAP